jgi:hypothetical protein
MFLTIPYSRDMRARVKIIEAGKNGNRKRLFPASQNKTKHRQRRITALPD